MLYNNVKLDTKLRRNFVSNKSPVSEDRSKKSSTSSINISKIKSPSFIKGTSRSKWSLGLKPNKVGSKGNVNRKRSPAKKTGNLVRGTSHIVDPSVRKTATHATHPLAILNLKPNDIDILKPIVYGSHYSLQKDPNPFYAPWNPPKLRRAEDEGIETPEKFNSDSSIVTIGKFQEAIEQPKDKPKVRSMFDCSNICFTFDKIHNPNDIGSVPLQDLQDADDGGQSKGGSNSSLKMSKKRVTVQLSAGKPLLNQIETVYKPFRKSKFLDSPHLMTFYVLKGKPILAAPLSFLGNTFMASKKLLSQNADSPIYRKLGIHRYEVNMEGFRDEQINFEICEKKVSVTGRKLPSQKNSMKKREVVEVFHLAPFLNMNRMRVYRTKNGRIIFEEIWKDEESSDEEANPMRRNIKKK